MNRSCTICQDRRLLIFVNTDRENGLSLAATDRDAREHGWPTLDVQTVSRHERHRLPIIDSNVVKTKRDAAIIIKDRILDRLEADPDRDILDKDLQPALNTAIKAQAIEDRREVARSKQSAAEVLVALLASLRGDVPLLGDGMTIEGDAVELD